MNIRNEWERLDLNQKVWISLAGALTLLAAAIGCFKLLDPQPWYVTSLSNGTCISSSQAAEELGHSIVTNPYKLGRWERKNTNGYEGTRTIHFPRGQGVVVEVTNSVSGRLAYFSKKSTCLGYLKYREDN